MDLLEALLAFSSSRSHYVIGNYTTAEADFLHGFSSNSEPFVPKSPGCSSWPTWYNSGVAATGRPAGYSIIVPRVGKAAGGAWTIRKGVSHAAV
jgi:hypothetical protein